MLDPFDFENRRLKEKLDRKRVLAFFVMGWERFSLSIWRLLVWSLFFMALWLFAIPVLFGTVIEIIVLLIFVIGFGFFTWKDVRYFRLPRRVDIDRRLEIDSDLLHRPVSSLEDTLANNEKPHTRGLWIESRTWFLNIAQTVKNPTLRAQMAERDPYALRLGVLLAFLLGIFIAGPQATDRIVHGFAPFSLAAGEKQADRITLWITPPEYTAIKQIVLGSQKEAPIDLAIPEDSVVKLRVTGGLGHPVLVAGNFSIPLKHLGEDSYGYEGPLPKSGEMSIRQMFILQARWKYKVTPDKPPALAAKSDVEIVPGAQIRMPLTVHDDYGVQDLTMTMHLDEMITDAPEGEPVTETRSVMSPANTIMDIAPVYDFTGHTWAGLPVVLEFTATDAKGQKGPLAPIQITLPEREFRHPVAKLVIALRKRLIWEGASISNDVGLALENIMTQPGTFQNDRVTFLSLRSASSRLFYSPTPPDVKSVIALLWDVALRIEDGNVSLAANNLREAQRKLEEALKKPDISQEEIAQLMENLKSAMGEYLMEMQKELQKRMANGEGMPMIPPELMAGMLDPEALQNFLAQMEARMRDGDVKGAQEMLSQLQRMMDALNPAMQAQMPPDMKFMAEGINEIQELIERQQALLDQSSIQAGVLRDKSQDYGSAVPLDMEMLKQWGLDDMPPPREKPAPEMSVNTQANKTEQEALRYILGQLMLDADAKLGKIPENMGFAEQEMRLSAKFLGENDPGQAIAHQQKTIEYLKDSMEDMSQQLMARMQQMSGFSFSGGMQYDPLGRPMLGEGKDPGQFPGSDVKIPEQSERKRVQEILELLRRRSGELNRPADELEYYRRLLRQF